MSLIPGDDASRLDVECQYLACSQVGDEQEVSLGVVAFIVEARRIPGQVNIRNNSQRKSGSALCSAAGDHEKQQPWNRPPHTPVPQVPLMQLLGLFEGLVCSQIGRTQGAGRAANADRKVAKIVR